jgi:hypothetical protein
MKVLLVVFLFAAAPLNARGQDDPKRVTPEQFPGQLAQLRVEMLYPVFVSEEPEPRTPGPAGRLDGFLSDADRVVRNTERLCVYLRAGLRDPAAVDGDRARWEAAWGRLDAEVSRLSALIAEGEELERGPVTPLAGHRAARGYAVLEDAPEFDGKAGARLHRAVVLAAYARNLREHLLRRSAEAPVVP